MDEPVLPLLLLLDDDFELLDFEEPDQLLLLLEDELFEEKDLLLKLRPPRLRASTTAVDENRKTAMIMKMKILRLTNLPPWIELGCPSAVTKEYIF